MSEPNADLCFPVLTPFKFRGVIVKPPAFVQMSADEARVYPSQEAADRAVGPGGYAAWWPERG